MDTTDIRRIRLYNQMLAGNGFKTPEEVVAYMGAMQAQAFDMAKWAIGVRLPGFTNHHIDEAINGFRIVRTHILRPTWHFVAAEDVHWMLELSAPRLKQTYLVYGKYVGIDETYILKNFYRLEKLLEQESFLTRQEILERLIAEGLEADTHTVNRLLDFGELDGIVGSGQVKGNKHSYCLLQRYIPKPPSIPKEEAIERLARRFFTSHGPATLQDFVWWSGMLISDAKKGLELIKHDFIAEEINGRTFWMKNDIKIPEKPDPHPLLLPPFDEYVVSYKDRSEIIEDKHYSKVMTKNGLFSPTIMLNGEIVGSWKKATKNKKPEVELSFFNKANKQTLNLFEQPTLSVKAFYD